MRVLRAAVLSLALGACGGASTPDAARAPSSSPESAPIAPAPPSPVAPSVATATAEHDTVDGETDEEEDDPGLVVRFEDPPDVFPVTVLHMDGDVVMMMRLGERLVLARVDEGDLESLQSGNGAVFDVELTTVRGGVVVVTHHNLDPHVDPPRFARSRWSEAWWFPADLQSGESAAPLGALGEQFVHAAGQDDGSVCISDALGDVLRFEVQGRALVRMERSAPCVRLVAEQPEQVFHQVGGRWTIDGDDYLGVHHTETLGPWMDVVQVAWSDGGQVLEGEAVPEHRSTRLVTPDADPEGRVHWYYLDPTAYCRVRRTGQALTCGRHRFRLADHGLIAID